ncbi:MAG: hypothetical protein P8Y02_10165 [Deinococcales bacterium]
MQATHPLSRPRPLRALPPELLDTDEEVAALAALAAAGLPVGSVVVVPAAVEERFYRLNNLPALLNDVFRSVDPEDPDEDDVEEATPAAEALVRQHYMLDEFIDDFYQATAGLPSTVCVRRPREEGRVAARGRPALLALKRTYQQDWSYEAVWDRLERQRAFALEARPVLLHNARAGLVPDDLTARAREVLGYGVQLRAAEDGTIVGARPA